MSILSPIRHRFWNNDGTLANGGKVYVYDAGTTTPKTTYTDSTAVTPNANPIILNTKGEAAIWTTGLFKLNVLQSDNTQITGYPVDYLGTATPVANNIEYYLGTVAGTNTITAVANPVLTAQPTTGTLWRLPANGANTGATTLNIDSQGALSLLRPDFTALQANDIPASGYICLILKRAGDYILLNPANLYAQQVTQVNALITTGLGNVIPSFVRQFFPTF